ncbi:MAG: MraY family glycosyltransferase [Thermoanaerobacterales bacterium]|nr:MraY family glycosyltransferase [Thermoanaerobacterales bacterium]
MAGFLLPLVGACTLGLLLTPWAGRLARHIGAIDRPDRRKVHTEPMPRLGGLAVYAAFTLTVLLTQPLSRELLGLLLGASLIVAVGLLDDARGLPPRVKLAGQVLAALAVIPFGLQVQFVTDPLHGGMLSLGWWGIPLTVFWLVAVTNAVNLIDGLDGLAAGTAIIAAVTLALVSWTEGEAAAVAVAAVLAAATLGFLRYNFHPARVFLGDTGSMFLGFVLAGTAIMGLAKSATAVSVLVPIVVLGLPLFDTAFAILRRARNHRPIFYPDKGHLHHRLLRIGLSHRGAVLVVYGVDVVLGASAVVLTLLSTDQAMLLLAILATVLIALANRVGVLGRDWTRAPDTMEATKRSGM